MYSTAVLARIAVDEYNESLSAGRGAERKEPAADTGVSHGGAAKSILVWSGKCDVFVQRASDASNGPF